MKIPPFGPSNPLGVKIPQPNDPRLVAAGVFRETPKKRPTNPKNSDKTTA